MRFSEGLLQLGALYTEKYNGFFFSEPVPTGNHSVSNVTSTALLPVYMPTDIN